jgi:hypothetical protein
MHKLKLSLAIAMLVGALGFAFTNCSKVEFAKAQEQLKTTASSTSQDEEPIGNTEATEIINQLPPSETTQPRPVTDLQTDPHLYDIYKCGDNGLKVSLCHFGGDIDSDTSICVGRSAADTHFGHNASYTDLNGVIQVQPDYLGPCRFTFQHQ